MQETRLVKWHSALQTHASAFETNTVQTLALYIKDLKYIFIKIKVTNWHPSKSSLGLCMGLGMH